MLVNIVDRFKEDGSLNLDNPAVVTDLKKNWGWKPCLMLGNGTCDCSAQAHDKNRAILDRYIKYYTPVYYLYVWEDVNCDYTCGIAFALATNIQEAMALVVDGEYGMKEELERGAPFKKYPVNAPYGKTIHGGA